MNGSFRKTNGNMNYETENKFEGYFSYYIKKSEASNPKDALNAQKDKAMAFFNSLKILDPDYAYAPEKWTLKEVVFHIIETEIIMLYRALRISKGENTALPGYDENLFVSAARVKDMNMTEVINLFTHVRNTSLFYFNHFNEQELNTEGTFSDLNLTVKGLGLLICGHLNHHVEVIQERYLSNQN